jgi:ribose transport system substrate-binding protein
MVKSRMRWIAGLAAGATLMSMTLTGLGVAAQAATVHHKTYRVAYLSYAVANSYDAPMLAAAKAVAGASGVKINVYDAQNSYTTQVSQLQDVINSGQFQGVIVQPIYGAALIPTVKLAIKKGIKVVNIDQILGTKYTTDQIQVGGLSGNVVFFPSKIGTQLATLTNSACAGASPCKVGLIHNFKGYEPDAAVTAAFESQLGKYPSDSVVAEADGLYEVSAALTAVQDMLVANPSINVIVGSDQDCEGAQSALTAAKNTTTKLVCYGASAAGLAAVKSGAWYADVAQAPATEGQIGMSMLIKAMKTGKKSGSQNPVAALPNNGILTQANVSKFTAEWPG